MVDLRLVQDCHGHGHDWWQVSLSESASSALCLLQLLTCWIEITFLRGRSVDCFGCMRGYMTNLVVVIALPAVPYSTVQPIDYHIPISRTGPVLIASATVSGVSLHTRKVS